MMWLREQIGYVGQQPILFSGTIKSNILLGKPDATDDEIRKAAKAANAHDFIMEMDNGYDSDVGTGGSLLSGGQVLSGNRSFTLLAICPLILSFSTCCRSSVSRLQGESFAGADV